MVVPEPPEFTNMVTIVVERHSHRKEKSQDSESALPLVLAETWICHL